jgi:hypothetical protein
MINLILKLIALSVAVVAAFLALFHALPFLMVILAVVGLAKLCHVIHVVKPSVCAWWKNRAPCGTL